MPLMPAFHRRKKHAGLIARLIAGYGELELLLAYCAGAANATLGKPAAGQITGDFLNTHEKDAITLLFSERGETRRFEIGKKQIYNQCVAFGLEAEYKRTMEAFKNCMGIRNLFSHCTWGQSKKRGLFFVNLEEQAKQSGALKFVFRHASAKTLKETEDYFWLTFVWLNYLASELCFRSGLWRTPLHPRPQKIPSMKTYTAMFPPKALY